MGFQVHLASLDLQKARRERETSRLAPFLDAVDLRLHRLAGVNGALRASDAAKFREAIQIALGTEMYERSAVMVLARRHNALGLGLADYMANERVVRETLGAIADAFQLDEQKVTVTVDSGLIDALVRAQQALTTSIANLFDAIDDYLDGPALH